MMTEEYSHNSATKLESQHNFMIPEIVSVLVLVLVLVSVSVSVSESEPELIIQGIQLMTAGNMVEYMKLAQIMLRCCPTEIQNKMKTVRDILTNFKTTGRIWDDTQSRLVLLGKLRSPIRFE